VSAGVALGSGSLVGVAGAALACGAPVPPEPAEPHATADTSIEAARNAITARIVSTS